jgi:hypothetical protein
VIVSTGHTDPAALDPLPANVLARRFVPQPEVLARAALFVTHGGMNSVNEATHAARGGCRGCAAAAETSARVLLNSVSR